MGSDSESADARHALRLQDQCLGNVVLPQYSFGLRPCFRLIVTDESAGFTFTLARHACGCQRSPKCSEPGACVRLLVSEARALEALENNAGGSALDRSRNFGSM